MAEFVDHYEVLGVNATASVKDIQKSYRKKALQLHPDKHVDLPSSKKSEDLVAKFHELKSSYDILTNADSRRAFDDTYNLKAQAKKRKLEQSVTRRKMQDDLEVREAEAAKRMRTANPTYPAGTKAHAEELNESLRREFEDIERIRVEAVGSQVAAKKDNDILVAESSPEVPVEESLRTVKLKWKSSLDPIYVGDLKSQLDRLGEIEVGPVLAKSRKSAVVTFVYIEEAAIAVTQKFEVGGINIDIKWLDSDASKSFLEKSKFSHAETNNPNPNLTSIYEENPLSEEETLRKMMEMV